MVVVFEEDTPGGALGSVTSFLDETRESESRFLTLADLERLWLWLWLVNATLFQSL